MSEYQDIVLRAIETAQKQGAQHARVGLHRSQSVTMTWRKAKIENMTSSGEAALVLELFVDGRFGQYYTSDTRDDSVRAFIERCVAMTRLLEEDPARTLADPARYADRFTDDLDIYDSSAETMTPNDLAASCKELEELALAHSEVPVFDATTYANVYMGQSCKVTTNGFSGEERSTVFSRQIEMVLKDGDKKPSWDAYSYRRHLADLRSSKDIVDECARFGAFMIGQKKLASGNRTLIFDRRVATQMVKKYLNPLTGMSLILKNSYFEGKQDQKVASDLFDLHDEPLMKRGLGSTSYDSEGVSLHPMTIFDKGTLKQFFINTYAGNKLGMAPTTGSYSALVLTPGKRSLDEMIADVKDGIYVLGLLGGNQDNVRGDFSHGIVGVAIENGKLTTPVSEMNITGNHTDLWQRLVEVGNDPSLDSTHRIPSLRIDDVSVSGT